MASGGSRDWCVDVFGAPERDVEDPEFFVGAVAERFIRFSEDERAMGFYLRVEVVVLDDRVVQLHFIVSVTDEVVKRG